MQYTIMMIILKANVLFLQNILEENRIMYLYIKMVQLVCWNLKEV